MDASERAHSSLGASPSSFAAPGFSPHFLLTGSKNSDAGAGGGGGGVGGGVGIGSRSRPVGIPPASPHSRIQINGSGSGGGGGRPPAGQGHSRSLSQPPAFFSLDSLPPLSPSPAAPDLVKCSSFRMAAGGGEGESEPPRKAHRRSHSEVPFSFSGGIQSPFGRGLGSFVKPESEWEVGGESVDELFSVYMNLDAIASDDSRASGSRTNGAESSENEADSGVIDSTAAGPSPESAKRGHGRSLSMDSFMGKLPSFGDESPKLPPSPGSNSNTSDLDLGTGNFTSAEMKKIMTNGKLVEMAASDPKRVKRILANRQSAARSKERKMRYISELEHKVQTLQTEATTLSAQLTLLQRDSSGLMNQNNELKFRLQAMEQQAQLRDALNEALTAEVQRLKLATQDLGGAPNSDNISPQQMQLNPQMFQMQHQQPQPSFYQQQQQKQRQRQEHHQQTNECAATQKK